jgi:hypothetical protein
MVQTDTAFETALDRAANRGPIECPSVTQADEEWAKVQWLRKVTADDVHDQVAGCFEAFEMVMHIGSPELIGLLMLKIKEVYATRLALAELYGHGAVVLPDVDTECSKLIAQWTLEQQTKPTYSLESVMGIGPADFPSLRGVKS